MERGEWGTSAQHVRQVEQSGRARGKVALRLRAVLMRGALVDRAADGDWWLAARLASSDRDAWQAAWRLDERLQAGDAWHGEGFFSRRHVAEGWGLDRLGLDSGPGFGLCVLGFSSFKNATLFLFLHQKPTFFSL